MDYVRLETKTSVDAMELTPKPNLVVSGLSSRAKARQICWEYHLSQILDIPPEEEVVIRKLLAVYRRRQTRKLGARNEDPDPYDPSYIFFCLKGPRET